MIPTAPTTTLFPYTTLFRSSGGTISGGTLTFLDGTSLSVDASSSNNRLYQESINLDFRHPFISSAGFLLKKKGRIGLNGDINDAGVRVLLGLHKAGAMAWGK